MNGPFLLTSHGVDFSCALILIFMFPPFFLYRCSVTCIFFLCIYTVLVMIPSGLQKRKILSSVRFRLDHEVDRKSE